MSSKIRANNSDQYQTRDYSPPDSKNHEATAPAEDISAETVGLPSGGFDVNKLPGINTVSDKIDLAALLLNVLPPDEDYNYLDEESHNLNSREKLGYNIACDAFRCLPSDPELVERLGLSFMQLRDYKKSLACYQRGVESGSPSEGVAWNQIAWCEFKLGQLEDALSSSNKALELLPDLPNLYDTCAAILSSLGRKDQAISLVKRGMDKLAPEALDLNYQLASLYENTGEIEKAREYWQRYLSVAGSDFGHRKAITRVCNKLSRYGKTVSIPDFIKANRKELLESMISSHLLCYNYFEEFTKSDKTQVNEVRTQLGLFIENVCASYTKIFDTIRSSATRKEKPILARHLNLMSIAHLLQAKLEKVDAWLHEACALSSDKAESKALLYAYYIMKVFEGVDSSEEYKFLKAALKINRKPGHAHVLLARHYCSKRAFRKIEGIWKDVKKGESKYSFSHQEQELLEEAEFGVGLWRSVAKLIKGKDDEALAGLNELLRMQPQSPELRYWLTVVHLRKGNTSRAREMFYSIPAGILPESISRKMERIIEAGSIRGSYSDDALFQLRSPRMTGCSSSPITTRR